MYKLGQTQGFPWDTCIYKIRDDQETVKSPRILNFPDRWKPGMLKMQCLYVAGTMAIRCLLQDKLNSGQNFFTYSLSQNCWDTFLSSGPPNVGSQDLVSYSSCNCDITAFSGSKRRQTRRKKKGFSGSVPTIFVWDCRLILSFFCLLALINSWIISTRRQRKLRINLAEKILTSN